MENININEVEIKKLLRDLKIDKAPGIDNIHPRFLKETAESITKPLTIL